MKCTGKSKGGGQSLSQERIELCNNGKCQLRAGKREKEQHGE